ncbi:YycH family regulatory protein [Brevibacillus laterosporus]|uniref:YycH family regulatory protein n=1 Tax=Brevibacillus laterosporus TaxID=1465 RepID=UPI00037BADB7|nr:two-component system activity regulator YycH [Brevibacillus laterosporus]ATO49366.1 transcriptional regulator [Brevibacillus laterosporus DSM 25]AYB40538.1 transcriptional regulator [Brevibacillus laterosporus]MBG9775861.1 transcriptional regulator [Brevibacillus laterosporus]MBG9800754.1 transcriptional regulator [Brevibacillus laterosporus]MBM7111498.1 Two-component system YycF/YycG regulatory protein YycH [Brevibacillus laterosporus]
MSRERIENIKSVVLVVLVLLSLIWTSLLLNNQPQLEFISPATFVPADKQGASKQAKDFVVPDAILFHYGEDRHTKAISSDDVYRILMGQVQNWYFNEFSYYPMTEEKWDSLTRKKLGLELQYNSLIPISVMEQVLTLRDVDQRLTGIDRVWLYYEEADDTVYALFLSTKDHQSFRAKTAVSPKDLRNSYLLFGKNLPEQILKTYKDPQRSPYIVQDKLSFWSIYYLPKKPSVMSMYNYNYLPISRKQLLESYFLDPGLVRQIVERDGTNIYTDGTRSVQVRNGQHLMTLTTPVWQAGDTQMTAYEQLQESVSFINQHMGWIDDFRLRSMEERTESNSQIIFRQYLGAFPVISQDSKLIDNIQLNMDKGQVQSMRRSLIDLDTFFGYKEVNVASGTDLITYLQENKIDTEKVSNIYLAYQLIEQKGYMQLIPAWVVQLEGVYNKIIDVRSAVPKGGKVSGLE